MMMMMVRRNVVDLATCNESRVQIQETLKSPKMLYIMMMLKLEDTHTRLLVFK